jgi:signal transduction histidine kinase
MVRARASFVTRYAWLLCLLGAFPSHATALDADPQVPVTPARVLVLCSDNRLLPANILFDQSMRAALASDATQPIECWSEFLDEVRFPEGWGERTRDLVRWKYGEHPADVIVAFAPPSLEFCLRYRPEFFTNIPIVFAGLGLDPPGGKSLEIGVTGVRGSFDGPGTLRLALRLHPRTRQVFVITGGDQPGEIGAKSGLLPEAEFHLPIRYLPRQPLAQLLHELSGLPENSLVIDLSGFGSGAGDLMPPQEAMERTSAAAPAPIYGIVDPLVGYGLVGAVTTPIDEIGRATAAMVIEVLSRKDPSQLPPVRSLAATPLVDWRQLRRWGLRKSQLPPGSVVRFEPPSFWRQHVLLVVTTSVLFLLQSGLILSLIFQSRRRRRAELEVRRRREELAHMTRVATISELTASLAHEINQPLAAILSNAQAAQRLLSTGGEQVSGEIQEILADIAADDRRAGEVIRRMRALLRKGEYTPAEIEVNDLVDEVIGLIRGEMILQNVSLVLELSPKRLLVHGDRVQLQQVLLNLMVNALDAMKDISGGTRRVVVHTAMLAGERSVEVSVRDSGIGVPDDVPERIFEPLFTTKPHGLGLGLAICRSIIQAHGGRIGSRNNAERGATFWFTLPALEEARS